VKTQVPSGGGGAAKPTLKLQPVIRSEIEVKQKKHEQKEQHQQPQQQQQQQQQQQRQNTNTSHRNGTAQTTNFEASCGGSRGVVADSLFRSR
jgi:hypothetical protein